PRNLGLKTQYRLNCRRIASKNKPSSVVVYNSSNWASTGPRGIRCRIAQLLLKSRQRERRAIPLCTSCGTAAHALQPSHLERRPPPPPTHPAHPPQPEPPAAATSRSCRSSAARPCSVHPDV